MWSKNALRNYITLQKILNFNDELLQWKVKEFYDKLDAVDPTLRPKIEECVDDANIHYYSHISKRRRSPEVKSQKASGPIPLSEDRRKKAKSVPPSPPQPPHKHKRRKHSWLNNYFNLFLEI